MVQFPTEPTTREGWTVIVWSAIVVFLMIAAIAFYSACRAAAPGAAWHLSKIGLACVGIAAAIAIVRRAIHVFLDS